MARRRADPHADNVKIDGGHLALLLELDGIAAAVGAGEGIPAGQGAEQDGLGAPTVGPPGV